MYGAEGQIDPVLPQIGLTKIIRKSNTTMSFSAKERNQNTTKDEKIVQFKLKNVGKRKVKI